MSQQSEDRLPEAAPAGGPTAPSARILPFERPRSELQRAIQERAQEAIDLDRDREREVKRPQPLKWLIITALALIPVILTFGAVDGFLRAFYRITQTYSAQPAQTDQSAQPQASEPQANEPQAAPAQSEPGVVMLLPPATQQQATPPEQSARAPDRK